MTEREALLKKLMAFSFAAYDWNLYLDTHPTDAEAIKQFRKMTEKANEIRKEYLRKFEPLKACETENPNFWEWIEEPWPWDRY